MSKKYAMVNGYQESIDGMTERWNWETRKALLVAGTLPESMLAHPIRGFSSPTGSYICVQLPCRKIAN